MRNNYNMYIVLSKAPFPTAITESTKQSAVSTGREFFRDVISDKPEIIIGRNIGASCRETLVANVSSRVSYMNVASELGYTVRLVVQAMGDLDLKSATTYNKMDALSRGRFNTLLGSILGSRCKVSIDDGGYFTLDVRFDNVSSSIRLSAALLIMRMLYTLWNADSEFFHDPSAYSLAINILNYLKDNKLSIEFESTYGGREDQLVSLCMFLLNLDMSHYRSNTGLPSNGPDTFVRNFFNDSTWEVAFQSLSKDVIYYVLSVYGTNAGMRAGAKRALDFISEHKLSSSETIREYRPDDDEEDDEEDDE